MVTNDKNIYTQSLWWRHAEIVLLYSFFLMSIKRFTSVSRYLYSKRYNFLPAGFRFISFPFCLPKRFDKPLECAYGSGQLNFALHVRLGDRAKLLGDDDHEYFNLLEAFMATVSEALLRKGRDHPVFHVFSETTFPCPYSENGTFPEFPMWPTEVSQVWRGFSRPTSVHTGIPTHSPIFFKIVCKLIQQHNNRINVRRFRTVG